MRFCFDLFEVSLLIRLHSQSSKISAKMELFSCFQSSLKFFLGDVLEKIYFLGDFLLFQILCSIFYIKLSIITCINSATNGSGSTPEKVFSYSISSFYYKGNPVQLPTNQFSSRYTSICRENLIIYLIFIY